MDRVDWVRVGRLGVVLAAGAALAACATITPRYAVRQDDASRSGEPHATGPGGVRPKGTDQPYQVAGIWYVPHEQPHYDETGIASWYGDAFHMKATATGEIFDMNQVSAAHTTLPLPSMVEVTNLDNGRKMTVRVNDRGPFVGGRIIDLSRAAAQELGYDRAGIAHVRVRYVGPAPLAGPEAGVRYARATQAPMAPRTTRRPADEEIFDEAVLTPVAVKPLVAAPEAVSVSTLAPLPAAPSSRDTAAPSVPRDTVPPPAPIRGSRDVYGPIRPTPGS
jgi:rare lipoprotein A